MSSERSARCDALFDDHRQVGNVIEPAGSSAPDEVVRLIVSTAVGGAG
ncbi:MAG: hypothetical protein KIT89_00350 [Microcella sp.]|nr:hypothetical protein [Microcella sp.]UYN83738.1 MAG: hypothetical protein KIT89_00350 [Microcella sp.]